MLTVRQFRDSDLEQVLMLHEHAHADVDVHEPEGYFADLHSIPDSYLTELELNENEFEYLIDFCEEEASRQHLLLNFANSLIGFDPDTLDLGHYSLYLSHKDELRLRRCAVNIYENLINDLSAHRGTLCAYLTYSSCDEGTYFS